MIYKYNEAKKRNVGDNMQITDLYPVKDMPMDLVIGELNGFHGKELIKRCNSYKVKNGAKIEDELLHKLNYPENKIEHVKKCIENHRSSRKAERNTVEEQCVADADAIAHFDAIPSLFSLAYKDRKMNIQAGANFVKEKLKRDYQKLSPKTKELMQARYKNIMKEVFLEE